MEYYNLIRTVDGVHFTDTLLQDYEELESLKADSSFGGGGSSRGIVVATSILSSQNLAWDLWFYDRRAGRSPDPNADGFLGYWGFVATDAKQVTSPAHGDSYYYHINGLQIPILDDGFAGEVHVGLVNRSATPKDAYEAKGAHFTLILLVQRVNS